MFSLDPMHPIVQLVRDDTRYRLDAYMLVFEALNYAQNKLNMGGDPVEVESAYDDEDATNLSPAR